MKRIILGPGILALTLVSLLASPAAAQVILPHANPIPMAWLQVAAGPVIPLSGWQQVAGGWELNFTQQAANYRVSGNVTTMTAIPYISYGVAFANNSNGLIPFALGISNPFDPIALATTVYASYSGSGTDVTGNGFAITPNTPDQDGDGVPEIAVNLLNGITNMGVDVGWGFLDGPGVPGHSNNLGTYSSGPQPGPLGGPWNQLDTVLGFDLSGLQDIATINGYTSVTPVPEPASLMLLGTGLIGAVFVARKRRR